MSRKKLIMLGMIVGSIAGGYLPLCSGMMDLWSRYWAALSAGLLASGWVISLPDRVRIFG